MATLAKGRVEFKVNIDQLELDIFDKFKPPHVSRSQLIRDLMQLYVDTKGSIKRVGEKLKNAKEERATAHLNKLTKRSILDMTRQELVGHVQQIQEAAVQVMVSRKRPAPAKRLMKTRAHGGPGPADRRTV